MNKPLLIADLNGTGWGIQEGTRRVIKILDNSVDILDYSKTLYIPKIMPLKRTIKLFIFNNFIIKDKVKNKNVLFNSPGTLWNHKVLKYINKSAIVVHDTYILREDYPKNIG